MPKYTWKAKNKSGQTVVKEIIANSSGEAQSILVSDGFSDLKLMEDEVMTVAQAGFNKPLNVVKYFRRSPGVGSLGNRANRRALGLNLFRGSRAGAVRQ